MPIPGSSTSAPASRPTGLHRVPLRYGASQSSFDAEFPDAQIVARVLAGGTLSKEAVWGKPPAPPSPNAGRVHSPDALFHPVEEAILCDWFRPPRPARLREADTSEDAREATGGDYIAVPDAHSYDSDDYALANAVARIALEAIQQRLPQWGTFTRDGQFIPGRDITPRIPRTVVFKPQLLFEINWASTAPDYSWPEAYHVTYFPGFKRPVVTASVDSDDAYG